MLAIYVVSEHVLAAMQLGSSGTTHTPEEILTSDPMARGVVGEVQ